MILPSILFKRASGMVKGLDDFVLHRANRPLWVFAWTLFLGAIVFLGTFYFSAAEDLAALDRERAAIGSRAAETTEIKAVFDMLLNAWSAVVETGRFYGE